MIHRDERYFPNPDEFIPERFASPSLKEKLPEYSFIPFSAGPRFCIGKKFALFSIKIILAHLIRNFHIESANKAGELKGAMDLLLRPERGVFIRLKERF
jgi:cytochrome P450